MTYTPKEENNDIVKDLLNVSKHNLEERIKLLEKELIIRRKIFDDNMSNLGTNKLTLEERINRFRYVGFQDREMMIRDLSHLDFKIISEWTEYFRDMLHLKEKMQEAKSEMKVERLKGDLIE